MQQPMQGGPQMPQMPATPSMAMPKDQTGALAGQIQQGIQTEQQGAQQEAQARGQQAMARADALQHQAEQAQQFAQQQQAAQDAAYKEVQAKQGEINKQLADLSQQKVDPSHWWNSRTGLQKASAALGLAFSNIGASLSHQPAMNLIQDAINRDMDAQQKNIDNKRGILGQQSSLLEQNYQRFGNLQQARMATMGMQLQALAQQGEAAAMRYENPAQKAHSLQVTGELQARGAQMLEQVYQQQGQQAFQNNQLKLEAAKFGLQKQEIAAQMGMKSMGNGVINISGQDVPLPLNMKPEQVEKLREIATAHGVVSEGIKRLRKLAENNPVALRAALGSPEKARQLGVDDILLNYGMAQGHTQQTPEPVIERFNEALKMGKLQSDEGFNEILDQLQTGADTGANSAFNFYRLPGPGFIRANAEDKAKRDRAEVLAKAGK
jgi:hypothetical protein